MIFFATFRLSLFVCWFFEIVRFGSGVSLIGFLVQRKTNAIHQIVEFTLQRFNDIGGNEQMRLIQIEKNEFSAKCLLFIQMQEELFHRRITANVETTEMRIHLMHEMPSTRLTM